MSNFMLVLVSICMYEFVIGYICLIAWMLAQLYLHMCMHTGDTCKPCCGLCILLETQKFFAIRWLLLTGNATLCFDKKDRRHTHVEMQPSSGDICLI